MADGSQGVFPRYSQNFAKEYSSLAHIKKHLPNLDPGTLAVRDARAGGDVSRQVELYEESKSQIAAFRGEQVEDELERYRASERRLFSPNVVLTGHSAEVYCCKFSPDGNLLASAGHDKHIMLWDVFGDCRNSLHLRGHKNAILELRWSADSSQLFTASADRSVGVFDVEAGKKVKKFLGHEEIVNAVDVCHKGAILLASGSDDCSVRIWDSRDKDPAATLGQKYPVLSVCFNHIGDKLYSSGIDNSVKCWDLRKNALEEELTSHTDSVTGIALSHEGSYLLSTSMDQTVRCWDVRPYAVGNKCIKVYQGIAHGLDRNLLRASWSPTGKFLASGNTEKHVVIWDSAKRRIEYKLGGHTGAVNEVAFSPRDNLVASCSSDRTILLSELPIK